MVFSFDQETLRFIKPARTSRGEYVEKVATVLRLSEKGVTQYEAEASPLSDLSLDGKVDLSNALKPLQNQAVTLGQLHELKNQFSEYPSLRFAIDCLSRQWQAKNRVWVNNSFSQKSSGIEINGLVWMNGIQNMEEEARKKIAAGFDVIKIKVGALDFDEECKLLERLRKDYSAFKATFRLDANGAFSYDTSIEQLKELSRFEIHSIEQPIVAKHDGLEEVCRKSPIPIALDEELIGFDVKMGSSFLKRIKPNYLILKPTLIGGLDVADEWVRLCEKLNIGWWSTSALEGNIGLYDVALWASNKNNPLPQGLGTGSLFVKNFPSRTRVVGKKLFAI